MIEALLITWLVGLLMGLNFDDLLKRQELMMRKKSEKPKTESR